VVKVEWPGPSDGQTRASSDSKADIAVIGTLELEGNLTWRTAHCTLRHANWGSSETVLAQPVGEESDSDNTSERLPGKIWHPQVRLGADGKVK
jgi:hypothetical protein